MSFSVTVTYLLKEYTYLVNTQNEKQFLCTRETIAESGDTTAPPETLLLTPGEEPTPEVWGKSLADLYHALAEKITAHSSKEPHNK